MVNKGGKRTFVADANSGTDFRNAAFVSFAGVVAQPTATLTEIQVRNGERPLSFPLELIQISLS